MRSPEIVAAKLRAAAVEERAEWGGAQNARQWGNSAAIHLALADLLDEIAELAPYWNESYAAPFVPAIEKAYRVARAINDGAT